MEKKLQPQLRFFEFKEEWSIKKLDDLTQRKSGHTPNKKKSEYYNGGIKWISLKDSSNLDNGRIYESNTEISEEGLKNSSAVLLPAETVIMSRDAGVGKSAILGIPMAVSQHFIAWVSIGKLDPFFLYTYLQKEKKEFERIAVGSTIKTIGLPYFKKYSLIIPTLLEQEKIASFLSSVDNKIEKLEKKKDLLGEYKKGIMQKMFSQKIRFKDKNGEEYPEWEEKRLNYYLEVSTLKNIDNFYKKNDVLSVSGQFGIVNQIEFQGRSFAGKYVDNYSVVKNKDIVYTKSPLKSNPYGIIKVNKGKAGIVSTLYAVYKCKKTLYAEYLDYYFQLDDNTNKYLRPLVHKGAKNDMKINNSRVLIDPVTFPSYNEQKKIVDFLSSIDKKIEAVNSKIDEMKEFKKGLLQQMFV